VTSSSLILLHASDVPSIAVYEDFAKTLSLGDFVSVRDPKSHTYKTKDSILVSHFLILGDSGGRALALIVDSNPAGGITLFVF
jgi:hypothetical protein